ncbi:4-phosphopantoate--beta-alanine ligase [Candidatus Nitrosomarinus catalina]|jgi:4-phosphopantoate--beta-alanine ligase|uniref:4-phosphopantoate--beta-alanine ligase n=1 Tax=Candidatus Nitrosomarinus catalinensis TaxID=1898749 RepID=A0A2Z2HMW5_9ARCH|nr:phosphopantothenate/pantothenate synthetase [Candidatus Nitrosomarinus catalina]ARS65234.1 4-phosphopantoate--beta-alanine ligase [Candidatus Nitrosomarinus catalina]
MTTIPKSHPRLNSLLIREKLVNGFDNNLVAKEGLLAHGRGEAFDYLIGEKTSKSAKEAIKAAAIMLKNAENSVISVNGNFAALCPKEIIQLAKNTDSKIEVNLFYSTEKRKKAITEILKKSGAKEIFGLNKKSSIKLSGIDSARRIVDKNGIFSADVVLVPLEDGDRTIALKKAKKKIITFDLNPLSRTAQTADITIVDNVIRAMKLLVKESKKSIRGNSKYNNKKNLQVSILEIKKNLERQAKNV